MKRKYLDGRNWTWLENYTYRWIYIQEDISGYMAFLDIDTVKFKLIVEHGPDNKICLCDHGYKGLIFLPDDENWSVSVVYNTHNEEVEWYFDMIQDKGITKEGVPYFDDLYLDVVQGANGQVRILDEDELQEALDKGEINKLAYDMAYETSKRVQEDIIPNKTFMVDFFRKHLTQFLSEQ